MKQTILLAGATGNLGERILNALLARGAEVRAIVRKGTDTAKLEKLHQAGVTVYKADMLDVAALTDACSDVDCVVSALQGLQDVIIDVQITLLNAAIAAGVPRFIPSDFSVDFTSLPAGENRNFDLRRAFHQQLDTASISATSIFNGAFDEILSYNIPILDYKKKIVGYWGNDPDWKLDFTTMDDTAAYTAAVATDISTTPRYLRIASFLVSPKDLETIATKATGSAFKLVPMGSLEDFAAYNKRERAANPEGEKQVFPKWQNGQYMHDMFSAQNSNADNDRYPDIAWTSASDFIEDIVASREPVA